MTLIYNIPQDISLLKSFGDSAEVVPFTPNGLVSLGSHTCVSSWAMKPSLGEEEVERQDREERVEDQRRWVGS